MKCKKQIILGISIIAFVILMGTKSMASSAIVNTDTLRLRKEASTDATVITLLDKGEKLQVIEESGDWVKVKVNGITGFVHKDFVDIKEDEKQEETEKPENIIDEENVIENEEETVETENTVEENINQEEIIDTKNEENVDLSMKEVSLILDADIYILPLINSIKIGDLKKDVKVTIMDDVKGWFYIETEEFNGWIRSDKVEKIKEEMTTPVEDNKDSVENKDEDNKQKEEDNKKDEEENKIEEVAIDKKVMYVNYSSIYVRKGPGTENPVVDTLILNNQVNVVAEAGDWYKVEIGNVTGYIAKRLLSNTKTETTDRNAQERENANTQINTSNQVTTNTPSSSKGQEVVDFAKKYLGCRYVYGGSGPSTFDCSGFTMYVYKNFGISLSHSARAQSKNGTYVAKSDLQPGDLVFFKDYETMDGIGHCGIYIGDGNFIHASSGTGYCVKISTLLSGSYNTRYETARRLF